MTSVGLAHTECTHIHKHTYRQTERHSYTLNKNKKILKSGGTNLLKASLFKFSAHISCKISGNQLEEFEEM